MPHSDELMASTTATAPAVIVATGLSPYVYTAATNGWAVISGGIVSIIEIGRKGTFVLTGIQAGVLPMSRGDQVRLTFAGAPNVSFFKG